MAGEPGPHGIHVNIVCPTLIATDMTRAQLDQPAFRVKVMSKIALGRLANW